MRKIIYGTAIAGLLAGIAYAADPMATITARQDYYKSLGGVMKPMAGLAKSFDAEAAKAEAAKLEAILATDVAPLFAPGTSDAEFPGKTRAMAKIWENGEDVGAKGKAMHEAGAEVIAAANAGDAAAFGAAFGKLGGTCKSCHDAYRVPE
ncbi:c-type cytochrome [Pseudogemmobacter blasticus]|uniref:Cytochrome C n=1 Tax=Fuscovulum blasticum DSM 2131 TaxID=1188250 RepID=A0A2T4JDA9_FUSBL|nr:cytochrome c [Fuscovulum blasticum]PTE15889.1 cytochrome C [Fuscovulum blasticum DSM 2131]